MLKEKQLERQYLWMANVSPFFCDAVTFLYTVKRNLY